MSAVLQQSEQKKSQLVAELFAKLYTACDGYSNAVATEALKAVCGTYNLKVVFGSVAQGPPRGPRVTTPKRGQPMPKLKKNSSPEVLEIRAKIASINSQIAAEAKGHQLQPDHALIKERSLLFRALGKAQIEANREPGQGRQVTVEAHLSQSDDSLDAAQKAATGSGVFGASTGQTGSL